MYCIRYYVIYLSISVYAMLGFMDERYYPWFWYSMLMLIHYFQRPAGKTVLESMIKGGPGLFKTGKVGLVVVLFASMASFIYFATPVAINNTCDTSFQCIYVGIDSGIHGDMADLHGDNYGNVFLTFPQWINEDSTTVGQW